MDGNGAQATPQQELRSDVVSTDAAGLIQPLQTLSSGSKRSFADSERRDQQFQQQRGGRGSYGNRYNKRHQRMSGGGGGGFQHAPDNALLLAKQLLVAVTSERVFQLVDVLEAESRKFDGETIIISTILSCVEAFPTKTSTYAILVGALACKEATRNLAANALVQCANRIRAGLGRSERMLVRFLGASIKACGIESRGFFEVLDALVDDEDEEKEIGKMKESQVFTALSAIPWFACSASAARADEAEDTACANRLRALCDRLSRVKRAAALPARLASLPRAQQDRTDPACDRVAMGLAMAAEGSGNRLLLQDEEFDSLLIGSSPQLPRFGECEFTDLNDALSELKIRITAASKSASAMPTDSTKEEDDFSPTLLPLFPNGQPNEVLQVQRREKWIERFLARERVLDLLGSYCPKSSEAADALLALNSPYVAVESVFSAMLQMPTSEHSALYYSDVLTKLCMKAPNIVPAAIEDALDQILHLEPEGMDPDALDRLSQWLVCHLLEFDLDWPWVKWRLVPTLDSKRSVRSLVEQVLQRLDAILPTRAELEDPEKEIPQELLSLLPQRNPMGESTYFAPGATVGEELVAVIKTKPSAAQLGAFLEEKAPEPEWNTVSRTRLVVHAALFAGKASFTHMRAALERVGPALVGLAANVDDDEERLVAESALESAVGFWVSSPAWAVFAIGALIDVKVATPTVALQWLAENKTIRLLSYWKRRAMDDVLARTSSSEERNAVIDVAASSDADEATDLWLSRRRKQ